MKQIHFILLLLACIASCQEPRQPPQPSSPPAQPLSAPKQPNPSPNPQQNSPANGQNYSVENKKMLEEEQRRSRDNLRARHQERVRKFRNQNQFPIRYELFIVYVVVVCLTFLMVYLLYGCFKRYRRQQVEKTTVDINERYFKYQSDRQREAEGKEITTGPILHTFCPCPDPVPSTVQSNPMPQFIDSPYFGNRQ